MQNQVVRDQSVVNQIMREQLIMNWVMVYQVLETLVTSNENANGKNKQQIHSDKTQQLHSVASIFRLVFEPLDLNLLFSGLH